MTLEADVQVRVGDFELDMELEVGDGETLAVLGPNGAGKTTLLRALAGLLPLSGGLVRVAGKVLEDPTTGVRLPPNHRSIGVVFQDHRLFPHLTALDNVAFGLRCRRVRRAEARARALAWLERVGLGSHASFLPSALSGGQAQRVALARALVCGPGLLLLDEPLSALDSTARAEARRELRRHLGSPGGARLLITHEPLEAIALADRLLVLEGGRVVQVGTAADVTERPRSCWVANLVGVNLLRGRARGDVIELAGGGVLSAAGAGKGDVFAMISPRAVALHRRLPEGSPRNVWRGVTGAIEPLGDQVRVRVDGPLPIVAEITPGAVVDMGLDVGCDVWISVKATEVAVYPA